MMTRTRQPGTGAADEVEALRRSLVDTEYLMRYLGVSRRFVERRIDSGDFVPIKVGSLNRFDLADINAWLDSRRAGGAK